MASTYTSNIRLTKQGDGDNPNTWGQVLNDGVISLIDDAIAGVANIVVSTSATVTLTSNTGSGDQARSAILKLTGAVGATDKPASIFVMIPNNSKSYVVQNSVSYNDASNAIVLRVAGNDGVTIASGATKFVITNGTSVYNVAPDTFSSAITVQGAANFESTVMVSSAALFHSTVTISGNAHLSSSVTIVGAAHLQSTLSVAGAATFNSTVTVLGNAHVSAAVCASAFYGSGSNLTGLPSMPTGAIITWTVAAAPSGYLVCDGDTIEREAYAALFTVIGTLYGEGDGSTTFGIPDLRGKYQAGFRTTVDTGLTSVTAGMVVGTTIGNTGGVQAVTLATAQIPSHSHALTSVYSAAAESGGDPGLRRYTGLESAVAMNTSVAGGGGAHSNIPPTIILNYVIKT